MKPELNLLGADRKILAEAGSCPGLAFRAPAAAVPVARRETPVIEVDGRAGVIFNGRAHRNNGTGLTFAGAEPRVLHCAPSTKAELDRALARFAETRIETLVIDGGDGTIRDVLSLASRHFQAGLPRLAIVPSGKTNALAADLGVPRHWTVRDALSAASKGRVLRRAPVEVRYNGEPGQKLRGFMFGAGAFVRATALARRTHSFGAFNGIAVGLSLAGAIGQTLFAGANNSWRRGERMTIGLADGRAATQPFYLLLGSTLERLPLGIKPFGPERSGLKLLGVDAPPRNLAISAPWLLTGSQNPWLARQGYKQADVDAFRLRLESSFILDGELFAGGDLSIRRGEPLEFLLPA